MYGCNKNPILGGRLPRAASRHATRGHTAGRGRAAWHGARAATSPRAASARRGPPCPAPSPHYGWQLLELLSSTALRRRPGSRCHQTPWSRTEGGRRARGASSPPTAPWHHAGLNDSTTTSWPWSPGWSLLIFLPCALETQRQVCRLGSLRCAHSLGLALGYWELALGHQELALGHQELSPGYQPRTKEQPQPRLGLSRSQERGSWVMNGHFQEVFVFSASSSSPSLCAELAGGHSWRGVGRAQAQPCLCAVGLTQHKPTPCTPKCTSPRQSLCPALGIAPLFGTSPWCP